MVKDYSQGIIYKIWSNNTGRCYIGSTVQRLSARMGGHRRDYKIYKKTGKIICISSIILEDGDIEYKCIAKNPCENMGQLHRAEGFYQKKYECVNINTAGRTRKERYQDNKEKIKEYYQNNKNKILKHRKEYYKEKRSKKNNCLCCGGKYTTQNRYIHAKAKKHLKAQELQEQIQSLIPLYHQYDN